MLDELFANYNTGETLYAVRFQISGEVFVSDGSSVEAWGDDGHDADDYDVTLSEATVSGYYHGDFDEDGNISSGVYRVTIYLQEGAVPDDDDFAISQGEIYWAGSSEVTPLTLSAQQSRILNKYPTRSQPDG